MKRILATIAMVSIAAGQMTAQAQQSNAPYAGEINWALSTGASQSSDSTTLTTNNTPPTANLAVDGITDGFFAHASVTMTGGPVADTNANNPFAIGATYYLNWPTYWATDMGANFPIGALHVWFREDAGTENRNDDFSIIVFNHAGQGVLTNTYAGRPPHNVLINLSPAIQGEYLLVVPQSPLTTSDGILSLAEVQAIAPYTNVSIAIATNPGPVSIAEGTRATLGPVAATVTGAPQDRLTYQWQKNGVDIPSATATTYTTPVEPFSDSGAQFTVKCAVSGTNILTTPATLTVTQDTVPPILTSFTFLGGLTNLKSALTAVVAYDKAVDAATATNVANYNFGAGVTVTSATLSAFLQDTNNVISQTVTITVSGLPQNSPYSLTVSGVQGFGGHSTIISTNVTGTVPFYQIDWAVAGTATQSSTGTGGAASHAIDGNTDGFFNDGSVTINAVSENPGWWVVDLGASKPIGRLHVWFRTVTSDECQALFNSCSVRNDDFTLQILDAGSNVVWQTTYPGRPPTDVPYDLPAGVSGRYVQFFSQTPLTTSDGFFSLAEMEVDAPYANASITLVTGPVSASIQENTFVKLGPVSATVTGAPAATLQYQWQSNGVDIVGANLPSYQTPQLPLASSGVQYRCNFLISGLLVSSTNATVTVTADTTPPTIQSVVGDPTYSFLTVTFSEGVSAATAGNVVNYSLSGGLTISGVTILTPNSVLLATSPQTPGTGYTLTVTNIMDLASTPNTIAPNSTKTFTAVTSSASNFVRVGDPGNPSDPLDGEGAVNYTYLIDKYKLTTTEYAAFLNAVATDPNNPIFVGDDVVYLSNMAPLITRDGTTSYSYTVVPGTEQYPINFISGLASMRYVNWLSNGGTSASDTEHGTYTMGSALNNPPNPDAFTARSTNALYFLPTINEWYKAAYYDPTKGGSDYWLYGYRTDDGNPADPTGVNSSLPPGNAYSANFNNVASANVDGLTPVGAYINAHSYYGLFDAGGLLWEWTEPLVGQTTTRRFSGSQGNAINRLAATTIASNGIQPGGTSVNQGVRIAKADRLTIDLVTVGNPGNPADTLDGNGAVNHVYRIGKYLVDNTEYCTFLNAVATATNYPHLEVYQGGMAPQITQTLVTNNNNVVSYSYAVVAGFEKRPVVYVTGAGAMRMANWLCNGGTVGSDTETGAYTFTGEYTWSGRNPNAPYFLPTPDEWYKAAYYDPTKGGSDYWLYAVRTDDPNPADPNGFNAAQPPGNAFSANFNNFNVDGTTNTFGTTDVGAYVNAHSYYGTFDQSGNCWEWTEPVVSGSTTMRRMGGSQGNNASRLAANNTASNGIQPGGNSVNQGFRLAALAAGATFRSTLTIKPVANGIQISWDGVGVLQSAPSLSGPWTPDVQPNQVVAPTTSPQTVLAPTGTKYYRIVQQ